MIELKYSSYGTCYFEKENSVYLSGRKNRVIDLKSGKLTAVFGNIESIHPKVSSSGRYIALPNTYNGIEVIDRMNHNQRQFMYTIDKHHVSMTDHCAWHKKREMLAFSTTENMFTVDMSQPDIINHVFSFQVLNSIKCHQERIEFIKSFDIIDNHIIMICYRSPEPCFLASISLIDDKMQIMEYYQQVDCPDFVIFDQKDGYYLLRNFRDITHYSSFEKKDILSVEASSYISVSQNGMLLAVSLYPYRKIVNVYNLQSFKQVLSIPVDNIITSISFSDESHYLLISGKHPLLVECNY